MQEPKIVHKSVKITPENVDHIMWHSALGGGYNQSTNTIELIHYQIAPEISEQLRTMITPAIEQHHQDLSITLEHEKQHWRNHNAVPDFKEFCGTNYYQLVTLLYMDELSARGAGALMGTKKQYDIGPTSTMCAIMTGAKYLSHPRVFEFYASEFIGMAGTKIEQDIRTGRITHNKLRQIQGIQRTTPNKLFDKKFVDTVKMFFTFCEYNVFNDTNIPRLITPIKNRTIAQIQQTHSAMMHELHDLIEFIIYEKSNQI